jgi:glycosyltransferase involved in cell wall biosynthesis
MTNRPKVIAMVQLPPPMHGAAKMNQFAVEALAKGFDLQIIEMRFARTLSEVNGFSMRKIAFAFWLLLRLIWTLPGSKALYVCFAPTGLAYYRDCLYVLMAKIFRTPAILHLHGRGLPDMRRPKCSSVLQKAVFKGQTVILLGESLGTELDGLNCKSVIIRNCLSADSFVPPATKLWMPHDPVRLLWLSNLFHAKGIETLLAACQILRAQGLAFDLTIAGAEGDLTKADIDTLLYRYQMRASATCLGPVSGAAKQAAFEKADLFVFPSHYPNEAQPLVVLEAMAAQVPVITSDIATLPEFVRDGETGRLCPPKSPKQLANAIIAATKSPTKTSEMRDAAYQLCQEDFSNEQFSNRLIDLLNSIVERR